MLIHTVDILTAVPELEHVLVVSRDPKALSIAREHGARTVQEDGSPHLNVALTRATAVAMTYAAQRVLVLPADLPQLTVKDVQEMVALGQQGPVVVIAPDYHGRGTNGLLLNPTGLIKYQFGPYSYDRHMMDAQRKGLKVETFNCDSLAHDVDLPEDLTYLNGQLPGWITPPANDASEDIETLSLTK
jgi:2-phospho-L-lactate guanylyltransferase